jgi:hypothetical protein
MQGTEQAEKNPTAGQCKALSRPRRILLPAKSNTAGGSTSHENYPGVDVNDCFW